MAFKASSFSARRALILSISPAAFSAASLQTKISSVFAEIFVLRLSFSPSSLFTDSLRFLICSSVRRQTPSFFSISPLKLATTRFISSIEAVKISALSFIFSASLLNKLRLFSLSSISLTAFSTRLFNSSVSFSSFFPFIQKSLISASFISP